MKRMSVERLVRRRELVCARRRGRKQLSFWSLLMVLAFSANCSAAHAEDGHEAWLRYAPLSQPRLYRQVPSVIVIGADNEFQRRAALELQRGLTSMLGRNFTVVVYSGGNVPLDAIVLGSATEMQAMVGGPRAAFVELVQEGAYRISFCRTAGHTRVLLTGADAGGQLYSAFHLLEEIAAEKRLPEDDLQVPSAPIRWVDEWDNLDGSIERGYAGRSIFFDGGHVKQDLNLAAQYARLLASIGINGCVVNNVNADPQTLSAEHLREFVRLAGVFRPWGIRLSLAVDLSSPASVGGLNTFDPLDPLVVQWWKTTVDQIYTLIPDFGGFTVKADAEGRAGPSRYARTPADAANVLARALAPHHGVVLYRGFVYARRTDAKDPRSDRARAGYDNFKGLDGTFEPNVIVQVKEGPIDFQVREPVSPLFALLQHTRQAVEVQTSQEYTGQQRHMVFLVPMWKEALDMDMRVGGRSTPVKSIVRGSAFHAGSGGYVSVVNVGDEVNWLHHPMALANLYGFGRLAWNPDASSSEILDSWTRLTFGNEPKVVTTIDALQANSWRVYENYTGPLGTGTLNENRTHYGPGVGISEHTASGQWFKADAHGVGVDRTVATGSGYIGQYPPELAAVYESLKTCPDDLLLFMHHVPYSFKLHSGETVIQHIYNSHLAGAAEAATYAPRWQTLKGLVDDDRYKQVLTLFQYQAGHAEEWRDAVDTWFLRRSGVPSDRPLIPNGVTRIEAEAMQPDGYKEAKVELAENASGGLAMVCPVERCSLTTTLNVAPGNYVIEVRYFDLRKAASSYTLLLNYNVVAKWSATDTLPPAADDNRLDGHTSTRFSTVALALKSGDVLTLRGVPDGVERAPVDYVELTREP